MSLKAPIFLLCSERSGSNLITRMMNAHVEVCGPSPSHIIRMMGWNLARYKDLERDDNWSVFIHDAVEILKFQFGFWKSKWDEDQLSKACQERSFKGLIDAIYGHEASLNGKTRCFIKENQMYSLSSLALSAYPDAKFVYLVRDPRDMGLSWKKTPAMPGGVEKSSEIWFREQRENLRLYNTLYHYNKVIVVTYEDLVSDAQTTLKRICDFTDLDYDDRMTEFYKESLVSKSSQRINAWQNTSRPVMTKNFGKYKTGLSDLEIRYIEAVCHREMEILGYDLDMGAPSDPSALVKDICDLSDKQAAREESLTGEELSIRKARLNRIHKILDRKMTFKTMSEER